MSKKFELLRRNDNRKICDATKSATLTTTDAPAERSTFSLRRQTRSMFMHDDNHSPSSPVTSNNSFKTFFHRIGSTGMLSRGNQHHAKQPTDTRALYRSSSTSQLNTSSYIKCDDPTDGVNLCNRTKSTEQMAMLDKKHPHDKLLLSAKKVPIKAASYDDIARVANEPQMPSKRANFPYAFLRSKLSVLPEENGGSVINQKRVGRNGLANEHTVKVAPHPPLRNDKVKVKPNRGSDPITANGEHTNCEQITAAPLTYQRINSCLSSNESGYDSDSRPIEEQNVIQLPNAKDPIGNGSNKSAAAPSTSLSSSLSSSSSSTSSTTSSTNGECAIKRRRYKHIKLDRRHASDVLGIIVSPQFFNLDNAIECRYVVTDINKSGLANSDGKIRMGDEIVNVNRMNLRGLQSYEEVQEILKGFIDNSVELVISHDEFPSRPIYKCSSIELVAKAGGNETMDEKPSSNVVDSVPGTQSMNGNNAPTQITGAEAGTVSLTNDKTLENGTSTSNASTSNPQPKTNILSGNRIIDMLPLQNCTEYIPVYNRSKIAAINGDDDKWSNLGKNRCDFLSKYRGYASSQAIDAQTNKTAVTPNSELAARPLFEAGLPNLPDTKQYRYSYCEYKPSSLDSMSSSVCGKAKFCPPYSAPLEYRSIRFNRDLVQNSCDLSGNVVETLDKNDANPNGEQIEKAATNECDTNDASMVNGVRTEDEAHDVSVDSAKINTPPTIKTCDVVDNKDVEGKLLGGYCVTIH